MDPAFKDLVEEVCIDLKNEIVKKINSNIPPPNAQSTLDAKYPKTATLINSGELVGSIAYQISDTGDAILAEVGVFDEEILPRALANEYGASIPKRSGGGENSLDEGGSITIPERSFLRSTYDEQVDRLMAKLQDGVLELLDKDLLK